MRHELRQLLLAAPLCAFAACSDGTSPSSKSDLQATINDFVALADSLAHANGDPTLTSTYGRLASVVSVNRRMGPVTIVIDGVPTEFMATATQSEALAYPCLVAPCPTPPVVRSFVAWQRSNPRRVVQLTSIPDAIHFGAEIPGASAGDLFARPTLTYVDGTGGVFIGTSGQQSFTMTPSEKPCGASDGARTPELSVAPYSVSCTEAEFSVSFTGTLQPPPYGIRDNNAAGTHTLAMAGATVPGARLVMSGVNCTPCLGGYPPLLLPPMMLQPSGSFLSTLTVTGADDLTLTFVVTNPLSQPATVAFRDGQQYEFVVRTLAGTIVWRWSADKGFTQALGTRIIPAGGSVTYVEHWRPPGPGSYVVEASLTSYTHRAQATTVITLP